MFQKIFSTFAAAALIILSSEAQTIRNLRQATPQLSDTFNVALDQDFTAESRVFDMVPTDDGGYVVLAQVSGATAQSVGAFATDRLPAVVKVNAQGQQVWAETLAPTSRSYTKGFLALDGNGSVYAALERDSHVPSGSDDPWCGSTQISVAKLRERDGNLTWLKMGEPSNAANYRLGGLGAAGNDFILVLENLPNGKLTQWTLWDNQTLVQNAPYFRNAANELAFKDGVWRSKEVSSVAIARFDGATAALKTNKTMKTVEQWNQNSNPPVKNALNDNNYPRMDGARFSASDTHIHGLLISPALVHDGVLNGYPREGRHNLLYTFDLNGVPLNYRALSTDPASRIASIPGGDVAITNVTPAKVTLTVYPPSGGRKWVQSIAGTACVDIRYAAGAIWCMPESMAGAAEFKRFDAATGAPLDDVTFTVPTGHRIAARGLAFNPSAKQLAAFQNRQVGTIDQGSCMPEPLYESTGLLFSRPARGVTFNGPELVSRAEQPFTVNRPLPDLVPAKAPAICRFHVDTGSDRMKMVRIFAAERDGNKGRVQRGEQLQSKQVSNGDRASFDIAHGTLIEVELSDGLARGSKPSSPQTSVHEVQCLASFD